MHMHLGPPAGPLALTRSSISGKRPSSAASVVAETPNAPAGAVKYPQRPEGLFWCLARLIALLARSNVSGLLGLLSSSWKCRLGCGTRAVIPLVRGASNVLQKTPQRRGQRAGSSLSAAWAVIRLHRCHAADVVEVAAPMAKRSGTHATPCSANGQYIFTFGDLSALPSQCFTYGRQWECRVGCMGRH